MRSRDNEDSFDISDLARSISRTLLRFRLSLPTEPAGLAVEAPALDETIHCFKVIRALHTLIPYTTSTLRHLSTLPSLVSFTLYVSEVDYGDILSGITNPFPNLRHLKVIHGLKTANRLLSALSIVFPDTVESLEVYCSCHDTTFDDMQDNMYSVFPIVPRFKNLQRLTIGDTHASRPLPIDRFADDGTTLTPILRIHSLRELDIATVPLRLTTDDIQQIALAFPHLRVLRLGSNCPWNLAPAAPHEPETGIAVESLAAFARHCPELQELAITTKFSLRAAPEHLRGVSLLAASNLRELCLGLTHVTDPQRVAAFCADVYPLARVTSNHDVYDDNGERWARVVDEIDSAKNRIAVSKLLEMRVAASKRTYRSSGVQVAMESDA